MLKFQFEEALRAYRNQEPLQLVLDFASPDCEDTIKGNIRLAKHHLHNALLVTYYANGLYLKTYKKKPNPAKNADIIGTFLDQYFQEEAQAIHYLKDVTPYGILRISAKERTAIVNERPELEQPELEARPVFTRYLTQTPEPVDYEEFPFNPAPVINGFVQGPNEYETGELWWGDLINDPFGEFSDDFFSNNEDPVQPTVLGKQSRDDEPKPQSAEKKQRHA